MIVTPILNSQYTILPSGHISISCNEIQFSYKENTDSKFDLHIILTIALHINLYKYMGLTSNCDPRNGAMELGLMSGQSMPRCS